MNQSELVSQLIRPLAELDASEVSPKAVVIAALACPTDGWAPQALDWLEQGVKIDVELAEVLETFAAQKQNSQSTRHREFAIAKQWRRIHQPRP